MNRIKRNLLLSALLLILFNGGLLAQTPKATLPLPEKENMNFIVASDMGRRGESEQQTIANIIGQVVTDANIQFIAVAGDPIHDHGVQSTTDPEWQLKFENIYTAPSLQQLPFYVVSGNHEYKGSVQAILDYSSVSKRWNAPARYFSIHQPIGTTGQTALLVFIDTAPLINKYRESNSSSDAGLQSIEKQLTWLDSVLVVSKDRWKIVIGHHPVYAATEKDEDERADMQNRIAPILEKRGADLYVCGHIHNFQHIKHASHQVNYVVNSSASKSRTVNPIDGTLFCSGDPGFTVCSLSKTDATLYFVNHKKETIYQYTIKK